MDAHGPYFLLDVWRIVGASLGLLMSCALLKVAWFRWWQTGIKIGQVLGWVSHSAFALGASLFALLRLGNPPLSVALLTLQSVGIVAGVLAVSEELGFPPWVAAVLRIRVGRRRLHNHH